MAIATSEGSRSVARLERKTGSRESFGNIQTGNLQFINT